MLLNSKRYLLVLLVFIASPLIYAAESGLQPGAKIPTFQLKDQNGQTQTFDSLKGPNGLFIMFNRSADWCPFCKAQLVDLEVARKNFEAKGVRVVSITYDSPAILQAFAQRKGLHFTLLSDPDSKIIDAFGIRNTEAKGTEAGIPIPNYYLIGADGVIQYRHAETALLDRVTASYFYESIYGSGSALPVSSKEITHTPHVHISTVQSDRIVAPGSRVRLTINIAFEHGTHLYAPGADEMGYRSVRLVLAPSKLYLASPTKTPTSTIMNFPALNERIPIFDKNVTLTEDITAVRSPESIADFTKNQKLMIHGELRYQACTESICFPPTTVPVEWSLQVNPQDLDQIRVESSLQRK